MTSERDMLEMLSLRHPQVRDWLVQFMTDQASIDPEVARNVLQRFIIMVYRTKKRDPDPQA